VVIAHEWLTTLGGSDKVASVIANAIPNSRVLTAVANPDLLKELMAAQEVEVLWSDRLPGVRNHWRAYGPALALAWSMHRVRDADLLISSSHFAAKAAGRRFGGPHLCYCYTPMRVAWRPDLELSRLKARYRPIVTGVLPAVRRWDRSTARYVTRFAGISTAIVERIRSAYDRDADLIFPPVDTDAFSRIKRGQGRHLLAVGRLIPYKGFDLAVRVCTTRGYPLIIAGTGPDEARLRAMAGPTVRFAGFVPADQYEALLANATALLFPGEEDFGIVPVEALAAGCPVVALAKGGVLDSVLPGRNGILFEKATERALDEAIGEAMTTAWDESIIRASAARFSTARFHQDFGAFVEPYLS
jgi:glycosyltransferase involved in cell wall biosynthesis